MNAVIAMCTFCEIHGPRVIFATQTFRTFEEKESNKKLKFYGPKEVMEQSYDFSMSDDSRSECDGCRSIGNVKYLSNEHESRTSFLSARQPLTEDIKNLLGHACIRSLSCELHFGKDGICYFGDESRGHVLSHAFTLKDTQARGIRRSCSLIVFMKDKQFLLNMWPFFVDNLKQVIRELQDFAERKYNMDEAENPQRAARLSSVSDGSSENRTSKVIPRSLCEITNEKHVFVRIHMWFVWILSAGARHLVEICPISNDLLESPLTYNYLARDLQSKIGRATEGSTSAFLISYQDFKESPEFTEISKKKLATSILRNIKSYISKEQFRQLLYSSLTGIQILVRGPADKTLEALYALSSLVPRACRRIKIYNNEYTDINDCNFLGIDSSAAVPVCCSNVCRLDIVSNDRLTSDTKSYVVKWSGVLPNKLPTLVLKLEKYLDNDKLDDVVLKAQFMALQEEWANIAKIVHTMRGNGHRSDLTGLIVSLGAGLHDYSLLDSWSMGLPSNPA
ncbi:folliculin isoform X1 [Microplitis demolitor]|uniref:folliculin isoform X1 n=1 Tax=Microplitis demolitor TaxID=69319 RepID=UPI0004CDD1A1|nr:folliculin isoform X1 [Microplitis demolitor]XP_053595127.1 folliculin isoform X1 [Microplitis demolitor]